MNIFESVQYVIVIFQKLMMIAFDEMTVCTFL